MIAERSSDMTKTEGNAMLARVFAEGLHTQRGLSRQLPRLPQAMLSRLTRKGCPTLRQAMVLRAALGIPLEAWLNEEEVGEVEALSAIFSKEARASVVSLLETMRHRVRAEVSAPERGSVLRRLAVAGLDLHAGV